MFEKLSKYYRKCAIMDYYNNDNHDDEYKNKIFKHYKKEEYEESKRYVSSYLLEYDENNINEDEIYIKNNNIVNHKGKHLTSVYDLWRKLIDDKKIPLNTRSITEWILSDEYYNKNYR
jgi:hypothetical protein